MKIWLVEQGSHTPIAPVDHPDLLRRDFVHSAESQKALESIYERKVWLACSCNSPNALMFIRRANGRYSLVNHHEHGVHSLGCDLFSAVKGEARSLGNIDGDKASNEDKRDRFLFFRGFKKHSEPEEEEAPDDEEKKKYKPRTNAMVMLLWQLLEDSYGHIHHAGGKVSYPKLLFRMRDAAAAYKTGGMPVKDYLYTGLRGYEFAKSQLKRRYKAEPGQRHFALVIIFCKSIIQRDRSVVLIDQSGDVLVLDDMESKVINESSLKPDTQPGFVVLGLTKLSPVDQEVTVAKWAVQPVVSDTLPLAAFTDRERVVLSTFSKRIDEITDKQCWLTRPLISRTDPVSGIKFLPFCVLTTKDDSDWRVRSAFNLLLEGDEFDRECLADNEVPLKEMFGGAVTADFSLVSTNQQLEDDSLKTFDLACEMIGLF